MSAAVVDFVESQMICSFSQKVFGINCQQPVKPEILVQIENEEAPDPTKKISSELSKTKKALKNAQQKAVQMQQKFDQLKKAHEDILALKNQQIAILEKKVETLRSHIAAQEQLQQPSGQNTKRAAHPESRRTD